MIMEHSMHKPDFGEGLYDDLDFDNPEVLESVLKRNVEHDEYLILVMGSFSRAANSYAWERFFINKYGDEKGSVMIDDLWKIAYAKYSANAK
jgi:hypothetical protein